MMAAVAWSSSCQFVYFVAPVQQFVTEQLHAAVENRLAST